MASYTLEIVTIKLSDGVYDFYPVVTFTPAITGDEAVVCSPIETYQWDFGDGETSDDKIGNHTFLPCLDYIITLTVNINGTISDTTTELNFIKTVVPDFEISDNYGTYPLTFHVKDITDYSCTGFLPSQWIWYIIHYGCLIRGYGTGWERSFTIYDPGIYGLKMIVTDGTSTYSITKRDIIFVNSSNNPDGTQIEFAHESSIDNRRHLIKTTHDFDEPEKNSIKFFIWGTAINEEDVATNEIAELRGDDLFITKNLIPLEGLMYNIGSETERWNEFVGKESDLKEFTQSKILRLWSGK